MVSIVPTADELAPYVAEAITTLGFIRPDAADWLAAEIARASTKNNGRTIRETGTRLGKAERADLGIVGWDGHLSREVWDALTPAGRLDPVRRFDDTCARALRAARTDAQRERDAKALYAGRTFVGVIMAPPPGVGLCAVGMSMVGKVLPEGPQLPFPGCDRNVCSCSWRLVTRWELAERGR